MIQMCVLKYLIDAIYHHAVIGLTHFEEGVLFIHIVSMPMLATTIQKRWQMFKCLYIQARIKGIFKPSLKLKLYAFMEYKKQMFNKVYIHI